MTGIQSVQERIAQIESRIAGLQSRFGMQPAESSSKADDFSSVLENSLSPEINNTIEQEAKENGLPTSLLKAVIKTESGFDPNAQSEAGAQGLMQLMPDTANGLGVKAILDPKQNIAGGAKYLHDLIDRFQSVPKALAAYNAGPQAVAKFGGVPPYSETQNYVNRVLDAQKQYQSQGQ